MSILSKRGIEVKVKPNLLTCHAISPKILSNFCDVKDNKVPDVKLENIKIQRLDQIPSAQSDEYNEACKSIKLNVLDKSKEPEKTEKTIQVVEKTEKKKRKRVDLSVSTVQRNFITPVRAMSDFLLRPSDLESLPKTKRRSPYECEPPITVYWRKDVEAKAVEVWGSKENLVKERLLREIEKKRYQQSTILTLKRMFR